MDTMLVPAPRDFMGSAKCPSQFLKTTRMRLTERAGGTDSITCHSIPVDRASFRPLLEAAVRPMACKLGNVLLARHRRLCAKVTPSAEISGDFVEDVVLNCITAAALIGAPSYHSIGAYLKELAQWSRDRGLPPLNALVIAERWGMCGHGYYGAPGCKNWHADARRCIACKDYPPRVEAPTPESRMLEHPLSESESRQHVQRRLLMKTINSQRKRKVHRPDPFALPVSAEKCRLPDDAAIARFMERINR